MSATARFNRLKMPPYAYDNYFSSTRGPGFCRDSKRQGFALVLSLSLMAFVLVLLLSMTTLIEVEVASANNEQDEMHARQNAILGLKIALGQLQRLTGPDTRITAPAAIFDEDPTTENIDSVDNNHWIGAWDSSPEVSGTGNYHLNNRLDTTNRYYAYDARRDGSDDRFLGWLVSGEQDGINDRNKTIAASDKILIFGSEFNTNDSNQLANQVWVQKVPTSDTNTTAGNYAYWVSDENLKARVDGYEPALGTNSIAATDINRSRFFVNQRNAIEKVKSRDNIFAQVSTAFDFKNLNSLSDLNFLLSDPQKSQSSLHQNAHALSSRSISLLTDTYCGGLRIDLNALTRKTITSDLLTENSIPAYKNDDGSHAIAQYPEGTSDHPAPASTTWEQLHSYVTTTGDQSTGTLVPSKRSSDTPGYYPIVTRYQLNIAPVVESDMVVGDTLALHLAPIIVLVNPYNAPLELGDSMYAHFYFEKRIPGNYERGIMIRAQIRKFGPPEIYEYFQRTNLLDQKNPNFNEFTDSSGTAYTGVSFKLPDITMLAGEVSIFGVKQVADYNGVNELKSSPLISSSPPTLKLIHKDGNGPIRASVDWSIIPVLGQRDGSWLYPIPRFSINYDYDGITGAFQVDCNRRPGGGQIQKSLIPFNLGIGLSDTHNPEVKDDFYHLALGIECSSPNNNMRHKDGTEGEATYATQSKHQVRGGDGYQNEQAHKEGITDADGSLASIYSLEKMYEQRRIAFDVVLAGGFEYEDNDQDTLHPNQFPTGYRIQNRWLIGQNFRAPYHTPVATDEPNQAPNTLYGAVASYWPEAGNGECDLPAVEIQQNTSGNGFWGTGVTAADGLSSTVFFDVPKPSLGLLSIGQLQHMQMSEISSSATYLFGTGVADLKIGDTGSIVKSEGFHAPATNSYLPVDQTFLLNNALWDKFYFSGLNSDVTASDLSSWQSVPLNNRYTFTATANAARLNDPALCASQLHVRGGFNINSTSKEAWKAIIAGANTLQFDPTDNTSGRSLNSPISRSSFPTQGSGDSNQERLNGFRELSDQELDKLAKYIVQEVKRRGPFLSLSDFVNRRIVSGNSDMGLYGTLESAIRKSHINIDTLGENFTEHETETLPKWVTKPRDYIKAIFDGSRAEGIHQWITQADILQRIAPFISARSDTFVIRAYGESIDPSSGEVQSTAICEATVQRQYKYCDPLYDDPNQGATIFDNNSENFEDAELSEINSNLGRKYAIVSLRWL